jgi:hypothetical protein
MKKIMFNEQYGLQSAVLERRKTMTRRAVVHPKPFRGHDDVVLEFRRRPGADFYFDCVVLDADDHELGQLPLPYEVGDVVAIAQSYESLVDKLYHGQEENFANRVLKAHGKKKIGEVAGWRNKMYVCADLMPHNIRITDLWFERLQAISDDDCLKEGVFLDTTTKNYHPYTFVGSMTKDGCSIGWNTPREAFAALIDKVSGPNTWHNNPYVIAYTFELIK